MDDAGYIFAAFAAVWLGIFGYILMLRHHQRTLQQQIESLQKRLGEDDGR